MRSMFAAALAMFFLTAPRMDVAQAANESASTATAPRSATHRGIDISAARRKHMPSQSAPAVRAAPPTSTWTGPDPTKGPGIARLRELQRQGVCVVDEGYGRYTFCSNM